MLVAIAASQLREARSATEPSPFPPLGTVKSYFSYTPPPDYPRSARTSRRTGKGWFELNIDFESGRVLQVHVLKSTGVKILDDSAVAALLQWRAKPRRLRRAIMPVEFGLDQRGN